MTVLNIIFVFVTISLLLNLVVTESENGLNKSSCLDMKTNEYIEKCQLCQKKKTGNRNCFTDGVAERFFLCTDNADEYGFDCNLQRNTSFLENFVTLNELQNNDTCYFDLTNGKNGSEYRARFYLKKSISCSNSSLFKIERQKGYTFKISVPSRVIPGNFKL